MVSKRSGVVMDEVTSSSIEVEWAQRFVKRHGGVLAAIQSTAYETVRDMLRDGSLPQRLRPLTPRWMIESFLNDNGAGHDGLARSVSKCVSR